MNIIYHIIFCGKIYCIIYCIRLKSKTLFQRDSKIQWIRKYWHLFPSHTEVLKWAVQIQVGFPLHRHSGAHVSPVLLPWQPPLRKSLVFTCMVKNGSWADWEEWERSGPEHQFHFKQMMQESYSSLPFTFHFWESSPVTTPSLKGERKMQSWGGLRICPGEENGSWLTVSSLYHKYYKMIIITVLYHQLTLQPCFPAELFVLITSEGSLLNCSRDTSQFCFAESFIHEAMLTSAWNSSYIHIHHTARR